MDATTIRTAILATAAVLLAIIASMTVIALAAGDGSVSTVVDSLKTVLTVIIAAITGPISIFVHSKMGESKQTANGG